MPGRPSRSRLVGLWCRKADHDLALARHGLTIPHDPPYDLICFHAQQCAEKCLKALLVGQGNEFPKTHDLTEIAA